MPEGDTIYRTAVTLERWLGGREITGARSTVARVPAHRLVGDRVERVEARAKHLLIRFSSGAVLHTHMRMTGSWHVYPAGERWRKPASQARIVLEAGDRVAVCFNAPVVELLAAKGDVLHPGMADLGPDVLVPPVDLAEVRRRAAARPPTTPIAEVLLDQRVVSGIGNIWRCETLFTRRVDPFTPLAAIDDATLDALVLAASELMLRSVRGAEPRWVYGRTGRPCRRCRTRIASRLDGNARTVYWCPSCQKATDTPADRDERRG